VVFVTQIELGGTMSAATSAGSRRPAALRRCWLFLPGADEAALLAASESGADVLIQELEDFTPPEQLPRARRVAADLYSQWRAAGIIAAVRINPFETKGRDDLAAVMRGRPDVVLMSKVAEPTQVEALHREVERHERELGILIGSTELAPNIESARGVMQTFAIAKASPRVTCILGSTEDMAADLGAPRSKSGIELAYARQHLHLECRAAGVVSVDCPYTFADAEGCEADARYARQIGYVAKSAVDPSHAAIINRVMTPSLDEVREAQAVIEAFENARSAGLERGKHGDLLVEVPTYMSARRVLERAGALGVH
jgi:citrate lyase subunit beta/citryl-CoA lyase